MSGYGAASSSSRPPPHAGHPYGGMPEPGRGASSFAAATHQGGASARVSSHHGFSLPPNVKGKQRGELLIEVVQADGDVCLLWWGETREMRITPRSAATAFDEAQIRVPICTSAERFISYLVDDSCIDVRLTFPAAASGGSSSVVGVVELLPFINQHDAQGFEKAGQ